MIDVDITSPCYYMTMKQAGGHFNKSIELRAFMKNTAKYWHQVILPLSLRNAKGFSTLEDIDRSTWCGDNCFDYVCWLAKSDFSDELNFTLRKNEFVFLFRDVSDAMAFKLRWL